MKYEIKDKKKNALMKRDEAIISIDHSGKPTPNRKEVMKEAAKLLNTQLEKVIVTKISTSGGTSLSEARVFSYSKKDDIPEWKVKKFEARISKIKPPAVPSGAQGDKGPENEEPKPPETTTSEGAPAEEKPAEETPKEEPPKESASPSEDKGAQDEKPEEKPAEDTKNGASKPSEEADKERKEETNQDK